MHLRCFEIFRAQGTHLVGGGCKSHTVSAKQNLETEANLFLSRGVSINFILVLF